MSYNSPPNFFSSSEYIFIRLVTSREGISLVGLGKTGLRFLSCLLALSLSLLLLLSLGRRSYSLPLLLLFGWPRPSGIVGGRR
jgi:hypothetical protein